MASRKGRVGANRRESARVGIGNRERVGSESALKHDRQTLNPTQATWGNRGPTNLYLISGPSESERPEIWVQIVLGVCGGRGWVGPVAGHDQYVDSARLKVLKAVADSSRT